MQLADLELAKREARRGEPWEFIRLQWPHLLVTKAERPYFDTDFRLDRSQVDIIKYVFAPDHTECFIKGCTKYGKGFATSLAINIWFDIWPDPQDTGKDSGNKIILTGPSYDHVVSNLFGEVVSLRNQMRFPGPGRIQTDCIKNTTKHFIIIANPKSGEGFSGQHSPHTLFVFDEASIVADLFYANAKKQARYIIALSNPRTLSGWFREAFGANNPDENKTVHSSFGPRRLVTAAGSNTVNVRMKRLEKQFAPMGGFEVAGKTFEPGAYIPDELYAQIKPLIASQMDYARYLDIMSHPDESHRMVFGEGQFPKEDAELQVVLSSWLELHKASSKVDFPVSAFGLDVAASSDGDATFLAAGGPEGCAELHGWKKADVMATTGEVLRYTKDRFAIDLQEGRIPIAIDCTGGYGLGVYGRLRELGVRVIKVVSNKASRLPTRYENVRAELYGELGTRLNPDGPYGRDDLWRLPDDPLLFEELCAHEKIVGSDGVRFKLIPKTKPHSNYSGKTVDRIGRSPDRADALTLLWRAVMTLESVMDFRDRHLIHQLDEKPVEKPMTEEERRKYEWDKLLEGLCERMDGDSEQHYTHSLGL
jgi:hypothetical protein